MAERRKVLVTGGTSGIGLALVRRLAARHDVLVAGRRPQEEASPILPQGVAYVQAPLTDPSAATQAIAEAVLRCGWVRLDNAILNAGIGYASDKGVETAEQIRQTLAVNLTSSILITRALFPWLEKANGTLTLVGSVAHKGSALVPTYAGSKAGLHGLARALRSEWEGKVSVQVVHPGPTRTEMHEKAGYDPGALRAIFLSTETVANMLEGAIASRSSPATISYGRFLAGGAFWSRRL